MFSYFYEQNKTRGPETNERNVGQRQFIDV